MILLVETILLVYFGYVSLYSFILAIAGIFYKTPSPPVSTKKRKIAVLIPSYKEDNVIVSVARQALEQDYPRESYDVVVIADSLKSETVQSLKELPIRVVEVSFDKSTKVKSLNRAIATIGDDYEYALILDADNVMETSFLTKINNLLGIGHRAIQGQRTSKNQTTSMSILDGISETINNYIYRQGSVAIGISSSLIGSGMIFEYPVLKEILSKLDSIGGFDRELELDIIRRNIRIYYAKGVLVYDEKVESTEVFERQRTRWLSSQFIYLKKYFFSGWIGLLKGNFSFFNSAILKNIQLPRLINLGMLMIITIVSLILQNFVNYSPTTWFVLLLLNVVAMALAIPLRLYNWDLLKSILLLPSVFIKMFNLLFKLKGANKSFIHTPHGLNNPSVDEKK
jgi:cellulose synthase/poly-beta-1,6-N-acetylglucosamine synthase-like glycosyltransferase